MLAVLPPLEIDPQRVRDAVDEVLSRREYADVGVSILGRVHAWVNDQIGRALDALLGSGQASLVGTIAVLAVLGVVVFFVVRFARQVRRDPELAAAVATPPRRSPRAWGEQAASHERAGRWRQALRCRYRELLAELADGGYLDEIPGRTVREYLADVRVAVPEAAAAFGEVTALFERAWYGHQPVSAEDADRLRRAADDVRAGLRRRRAAAPTAA